jgi:hypothetical protein
VLQGFTSFPSNLYDLQSPSPIHSVVPSILAGCSSDPQSSSDDGEVFPRPELHMLFEV